MEKNQLHYGKLAKLVVLAQQGDEMAFATLYAATIHNQLTFAIAFLKDRHLAEEAVQEVYISLYKSLKTIRDPKTFVAYLNRINFNTCANIKKKNQRTSHYEYTDQMEIPSGEEGQKILSLPSEYHDPAKYYDDIELKNELSLAMEKLPDFEKAVILMRYYQNMPIKEIALALGCSDRTVKRHLTTAKNILRRCLLSENP